MKSVEKVIATVRGRRAADAGQQQTAPEIHDDAAQLHLAATVAAAEADDA